jgi:hypothetical protein
VSSITSAGGPGADSTGINDAEPAAVDTHGCRTNAGAGIAFDWLLMRIVEDYDTVPLAVDALHLALCSAPSSHVLANALGWLEGVEIGRGA